MHYPGALSKINAIEIAIQILGPIHPLHSKLFLSDDQEGPTGRTLEHDQAHMGVGGGGFLLMAGSVSLKTLCYTTDGVIMVSYNNKK